MELSKRQREVLKDLNKFVSLEIGPQVHPQVAAALKRRGLVESARHTRYPAIVLTEAGAKVAAQIGK